MIVVHVHCHVRPESVEAFREATLANARASIAEPGVLRFDVLQDTGSPEHVVLVEIYRTAEDPGRHKETAHYATWRDTVADLMAEPRASTKYAALFPLAEAAWAADPTAS